MDECQYCSVRLNCTEDQLVLWVDAELLAEKLRLKLGESAIPFAQEQNYFRFQSRANSQQVVQILERDLSRVEKQHIRVASGNFRAMMAATSLEQYIEVSRTAWFDEALEKDAFTTWFQPIVQAGSRVMVARECLIRLEEPFRNGGEIMAAAIARGRVHVFDAYARKLAIRTGARSQAPGEKLFINFLPSSIYDPEFCMRSTLNELEKTTLRAEDVVFEVVESEFIEDRKHLRNICEYYQERGFGVALDDAGTGANSLDMIPDLHPNFVKLDKSLVQGADQPLKRNALEKFIDLAHGSGARLIAEGIETAEQAQLMEALGVEFLQGYYFGKPAPAGAVRSDLQPLCEVLEESRNPLLRVL